MFRTPSDTATFGRRYCIYPVMADASLKQRTTQNVRTVVLSTPRSSTATGGVVDACVEDWWPNRRSYPAATTPSGGVKSWLGIALTRTIHQSHEIPPTSFFVRDECPTPAAVVKVPQLFNHAILPRRGLRGFQAVYLVRSRARRISFSRLCFSRSPC